MPKANEKVGHLTHKNFDQNFTENFFYLAPGMMKGQKEAGVLRLQLEKLKKLQEIQRQKIEVERKKREGIPITADDQVNILCPETRNKRKIFFQNSRRFLEGPKLVYNI